MVRCLLVTAIDACDGHRHLLLSDQRKSLQGYDRMRLVGQRISSRLLQLKPIELHVRPHERLDGRVPKVRLDGELYADLRRLARMP
jgi:hypothetical protein